MDKNIKNEVAKRERFFEITPGEYFRELELMEKQYGCEEELYPFVNMFLRNGENAKDISIRAVANGRKAKKVVSRDLISGRISYPDIAIFKKDFDVEKPFEDNKDKILGCIEMKEMKDPLLGIEIEKEESVQINVKNALYINNTEKGVYKYCFWDPHIDKLSIKEIMEKYEIIEIQKEKFTMKERNKSEQQININISDGWYLCSNNNLVDFNTQNICKKYISKYGELIYNGNSYVLTNKENKLTDAGQLFGELFWYGKVLYTNGLVWKYLKVISETENSATLIADLRNEIYTIHIHGREEWFEAVQRKLNDNKENVYISCKKIADLTKCYEKYKKNKTRKINYIKDEYSDMENDEDEYCEWKKLMDFFDNNNWSE